MKSALTNWHHTFTVYAEPDKYFQMYDNTKIPMGVYLNIDGVAHLPIPEVLWHSTNWGLPGLFVELHDDAVNASEDPDIDRSSNYSIVLQYRNASPDPDKLRHKKTHIRIYLLALIWLSWI
jgi:hypothetical protein